MGLRAWSSAIRANVRYFSKGEAPAVILMLLVLGAFFLAGIFEEVGLNPVIFGSLDFQLGYPNR